MGLTMFFRLTESLLCSEWGEGTDILVQNDIDPTSDDQLRTQTHIRNPTTKLSMEERIAPELLYLTMFHQAFVDESLNPKLAVPSSLKRRARDRIKAG